MSIEQGPSVHEVQCLPPVRSRSYKGRCLDAVHTLSVSALDDLSRITVF